MGIEKLLFEETKNTSQGPETLNISFDGDSVLYELLTPNAQATFARIIPAEQYTKAYELAQNNGSASIIDGNTTIELHANNGNTTIGIYNGEDRTYFLAPSRSIDIRCTDYITQNEEGVTIGINNTHLLFNVFYKWGDSSSGTDISGSIPLDDPQLISMFRQGEGTVRDGKTELSLHHTESGYIFAIKDGNNEYHSQTLPDLKIDKRMVA